jgi:excisionase family DNA binding protein
MTHRSAEEWLDIRTAAELAGVSDDTIRRRIRSGELPRAKRGERLTDPWSIPMGDLVSAGLLPGAPADAGPAVPSVSKPSAMQKGGRRDALLVHLGALREVHAVIERQIAIVEQLAIGADS